MEHDYEEVVQALEVELSQLRLQLESQLVSCGQGYVSFAANISVLVVRLDTESVSCRVSVCGSVSIGQCQWVSVNGSVLCAELNFSSLEMSW